MNCGKSFGNGVPDQLSFKMKSIWMLVIDEEEKLLTISRNSFLFLIRINDLNHEPPLLRNDDILPTFSIKNVSIDRARCRGRPVKPIICSRKINFTKVRKIRANLEHSRQKHTNIGLSFQLHFFFLINFQFFKQKGFWK